MHCRNSSPGIIDEDVKATPINPQLLAHSGSNRPHPDRGPHTPKRLAGGVDVGSGTQPQQHFGLLANIAAPPVTPTTLQQRTWLKSLLKEDKLSKQACTGQHRWPVL